MRISMKKTDFNFDLPPELIAQYPLPNRGDSRLLVYKAKQACHEHHFFHQLADFLEPGDLLVKNFFTATIVSEESFEHSMYNFVKV